MGYISYGAALTVLDMGMPVKILSLDNIVIGENTLLQGSYPIIRELNLAYRERDEAIDALLNYIFSQEGTKAIENQALFQQHRREDNGF